MHVSEILSAKQERPINIRPAVAREELPELLAQKWMTSNSRQWAAFLGGGLVGAAGDGNPAAVQQLLAAGATLNCRDRERYTALHRASSSGHTNIVRQLLREEQERTPKLAWQPSQAGPQWARAKSSVLNMPDQTGYLPLHLAALRGNSSVVRLLLESGADEMARDSSLHKETPLHHAVVGNDAESIALLVQAGGELFTGCELSRNGN